MKSVYEYDGALAVAVAFPVNETVRFSADKAQETLNEGLPYKVELMLLKEFCPPYLFSPTSREDALNKVLDLSCYSMVLYGGFTGGMPTPRFSDRPVDAVKAGVAGCVYINKDTELTEEQATRIMRAYIHRLSCAAAGDVLRCRFYARAVCPVCSSLEEVAIKHKDDDRIFYGGPTASGLTVHAEVEARKFKPSDIPNTEVAELLARYENLRVVLQYVSEQALIDGALPPAVQEAYTAYKRSVGAGTPYSLRTPVASSHEE